MYGPLIMDIAGLTLMPEDKDILEHPMVGGLILFSRNYHDREQLAALISQARKARPNLLIMVDQEGGRVQRLKHEFTLLPPMAVLGRLYDIDPEAAFNCAMVIGSVLAAELLSLQIDFSFAPVVDLKRENVSVLGDRGFHEDPIVVTQLAEALIEGLAEIGMSAVIKHFPGHGGVLGDSHIELPVDNRYLSELESLDLIPFASLVELGVGAVMTAHVVYEQIDALPASLSHRWVNDYLRAKLGFEGAVFSDDLCMRALDQYGDMRARTEQALAVGSDYILICNNREAVQEVLDSPIVLASDQEARLKDLSDDLKGDYMNAEEWAFYVDSPDCLLAKETIAELCEEGY